MKPTSAMIFAAGYGTRMGDLTKSTPKPMIPVGGRPMIDYAIDWAREAGLTNIVANTHHLADQLETYLSPTDVRTSHEAPKILETGGGLKAGLPLLGSEPLVTLNSDAMLSGPNPVSLLLDHWQPQMQALLLLVPKSQALTSRDTADFSLEHGEICRNGDHFYTGIQILNPVRLYEIEDTSFSLNQYWDLLAETVPLNGLVYPGTWCDVGDPQGIIMAEKMLADV